MKAFFQRLFGRKTKPGLVLVDQIGQVFEEPQVEPDREGAMYVDTYEEASALCTLRTFRTGTPHVATEEKRGGRWRVERADL